MQDVRDCDWRKKSIARLFSEGRDILMICPLSTDTEYTESCTLTVNRAFHRYASPYLQDDDIVYDLLGCGGPYHDSLWCICRPKVCMDHRCRRRNTVNANQFENAEKAV